LEVYRMQVIQINYSKLHPRNIAHSLLLLPATAKIVDFYCSFMVKQAFVVRQSVVHTLVQ
jgi:hypothetical protein